MAGRSRIIHVIGAFVSGGAESSAKDLALAMKRAGAPVEVAAISCRMDDAGRDWKRRLEEGGIPVHVGPTERTSIRMILWFARLLRAPDIRIVHIHLDYVEKAYFFARFLHRRRYGVLRKIHDTKVPGGLLGFVGRHSDIGLYYACGQAAYDAFEGRLKGEQVLVPNGLSFDCPPHDIEHRDERVGALGLDVAKTHFVNVASHRGATPATSQKAHDTLIRAWRERGIGGIGGVLHVMGDGSLRPEHEALAGGDPSIVFHGAVSNVPTWLSACDVFVLPSRWEGLPLSGVEAVGAGIPCILSDIEPNRELRCVVAEFFPVDDVAALGERLASHVGRRAAAPAEAVALQRERWGVGRAMGSFFELYDRLMPRDERRPEAQVAGG